MSGDGVDLGAVLQAVNTVAGDVRSASSGLQTLSARMDGLWSEVRESRREMASKADKKDVVLLRQTVTEYHSAVVGHGVLIPDLDDLLPRVEQHLGQTPAA